MKQQTGEDVTAEDVNETVSYLDKYYRAEAAQDAFAVLMNTYLGSYLGNPDVRSEIVELQKIGNVIYIQFLTTLQNAAVDGRKSELFFVREEGVIITDQEYVTIIHVTVPSGDPSPRGLAYTRIQEWFSGLAIPVS